MVYLSEFKFRNLYEEYNEIDIDGFLVDFIIRFE